MSRPAIALADGDGRADTDGTNNTDGASSAAALKGRPSTTLVNNMITASASPVQQLYRRDVSFIRWLIANVALLAKSLVYLSLFGFVSAIAWIYKYFLLLLIRVVARFHAGKFERDAFTDALNEVEKDSRPNE